MISIEAALESVLAEASPLSGEDRPLPESLGMALAVEIVAPHDVPPFDNSAMDGFAVVAADTAGASEMQPTTLALKDTIPAGRASAHRLQRGEAAKIMTGAPVPAGADAVVEVEATAEGGGFVHIFQPVVPGDNIRRAGEDLSGGSLVLSSGDVLGPAEIGVLASLGVSSVHVHRRPSVSILSTGSELVDLGRPLAPGQIRNSNSYALEAQCRQLGIAPVRLGIAPDDYEATRALVAEGLKHDVLISSGGVSVGEFDFVKDVQDSLGVERRLWQVAMKPGKPLVFGVRGQTLVFGLPGNPVAAMVSFELFIRPALLRLMGHRRILRPLHRAVLAEDIRNSDGRVLVARVRAWREGERWLARSAGSQGSGILRSMMLANGLAFIPPGAGGLRAGDEVDLLLMREPLVEPPIRRLQDEDYQGR